MIHLHKANILWIPAINDWRLVCIHCGSTLIEGMDEIAQHQLEVEIPDVECDPGESLNVHVKDTVETKDIFGG